MIYSSIIVPAEHRQSVLDRLRDLAEVDTHGCWVPRRKPMPNGYVLFSWAGRTTLRHRLAYAASHPEWDQQSSIDHLCRNRACCNPDHLEAVTQGENVRRGWVKNADTCRKGLHPWTPENRRREPNGYETCRECAKISSREAGVRFRARHADEIREKHRAWREARRAAGLPVT